MRPIALLAVLAASAGLSACLPCGVASFCPAPSPAFQQVEGLEWRERDAAMKQMTVEQRLDVYHDLYVRSGHPRTMLRTPFEGAADETFDAVMTRMTDGASFNEYFWILNHLALRGELDICDPAKFDRLNDKVRRYNKIDPAHPVAITFDRCEVVL